MARASFVSNSLHFALRFSFLVHMTGSTSHIVLARGKAWDKVAGIRMMPYVDFGWIFPQ